MIFKVDLNLYAFVGVIMLVGPGEEERHHDDRLRHRGAARRPQVAGRSDVRSLPGPLPSDHDDDDGGAGGHAADCAWAWAPAPKPGAARPGRRRRPGRLADADALHHAGLLSLHGGVRPTGSACGGTRSRSGSSRPSRAMARRGSEPQTGATRSRSPTCLSRLAAGARAGSSRRMRCFSRRPSRAMERRRCRHAHGRPEEHDGVSA